MKNLIFGFLATVLFSISGFANSIELDEKINPKKSELVNQIDFNYEASKTTIIVGCTDCGVQGCCILSVIRDDGTVRSTETCCKNIIVVKKPTVAEFSN